MGGRRGGRKREARANELEEQATAIPIICVVYLQRLREETQTSLNTVVTAAEGGGTLKSTAGGGGGGRAVR